MEYRKLGRTGLEVSVVGFGCGNVGGLMIRGEHGDQVKAAAQAMELGINYFDTASSYGNGQSEQNLGRVLNELSADVYVGTKVRLGPEDMGDIKAGVIKSVEDSLTRMNRPSVDLIQLHNRVAALRDPDRDLLSVEDVLGQVVGGFQALQAQGKIRFYGITDQPQFRNTGGSRIRPSRFRRFDTEGQGSGNRRLGHPGAGCRGSHRGGGAPSPGGQGSLSHGIKPKLLRRLGPR